MALDQWSENLLANGIVVNFNPDGSAAGREDYIPAGRLRRVRTRRSGNGAAV